MSPWVMLALLLSVLTGLSAAPEQGAARLRSLAPMPKVSLTLQITSAEAEHPERMLGKSELERRVKALQPELREKGVPGSRWLELGQYLSCLNKSNEVKAAYEQAMKLLETQAKRSPRDARIQTDFAEALWRMGRAGEAERVLRTAAKVTPDSWLVQIKLSEFCRAQALIGIIYRTNQLENGPNPSLSAVVDLLKAKPASSDQWERYQTLQREGEQFLERARKLAPDEPEVLLRQAVDGTTQSTFAWALASVREGKDMNQRQFMSSMSADAVCAHWAALARRCPTNFAAAAYWGWLEAMPAILQAEGDKPLDSLPSQRRRHVLEAMRLLETITEQGNPAMAAGAFETLSILRFMVTMEPAAAAAEMKRAVELDPSREQAWDGLTAFAIAREDWPEVLKLCEGRLKHHDTVRSRVLLAKAYEKNGQPDKGLAAAEKAYALDKTSVHAQLAYAALLIRTSKDSAAVKRAARILAGTFDQIQKMAADSESAGLGKIYLFNVAILYALDGQKEEARKVLKQLEQILAGDEEGKEKANEIAQAVGA